MTKPIKAVAFTSVIWLVVFGPILGFLLLSAKARWVNLRSDVIAPLSLYMEEIAAEDDARLRAEMAGKMGNRIRTAQDQSALVQGVFHVLNAHLKWKEQANKGMAPNNGSTERH